MKHEWRSTFDRPDADADHDYERVRKTETPMQSTNQPNVAHVQTAAQQLTSTTNTNASNKQIMKRARVNGDKGDGQDGEDDGE